jgi:hypothetical protein
MLSLGSLSQVPTPADPLGAALAPYIGVLKEKLIEISKPAAIEASKASIPYIREELQRWLPMVALVVGLTLGAAVLIGTQLPRWQVGGKKKR